MSMLGRFWNEEDGFLVSLELILAAIMLVLGLVAGMQVLRDAMAQELADLGMAIGAINNSFSISGISGPTGANTSSVAGSTFTDALDNCDAGSLPTSGSAAGGIQLGVAPVAEAS